MDAVSEYPLFKLLQEINHFSRDYMHVELSNCPFCKSSDIRMHTSCDNAPLLVACNNCGATGPRSWYSCDVCQGWNQRAEIIEELRTSTSSTSTPCHVPNCQNEGKIYLCDVHWADLPN
jgi:hypothetical protein